MYFHKNDSSFIFSSFVNLIFEILFFILFNYCQRLGYG
jgi:hypothetical protein